METVALMKGWNRMITKEIFTEKAGREPTEDELKQCNCEIIGVPGHDTCGWCEEHDKPRSVCKCIAGDNLYMHSKCCGADWDLVRHKGRVGLYCAKCLKYIGDEIRVTVIPAPTPAAPPAESPTEKPKVNIFKYVCTSAECKEPYMMVNKQMDEMHCQKCGKPCELESEESPSKEPAVPEVKPAAKSDVQFVKGDESPADIKSPKEDEEDGECKRCGGKGCKACSAQHQEPEKKE